MMYGQFRSPTAGTLVMGSKLGSTWDKDPYLGLFECIEMGKWPKSTHFERFESLTDTDERFRWI